MSFSSVLFFVVFLPGTLALYWLLPRGRVVQNAVLLVASHLFFISWGGPKAISIFLLATAINYALLMRLKEKSEDGAPRHAGQVLGIGIFYNLGQLLLLKYLGFFEETAQHIASLFGSDVSLPSLSLLLPIGISFWTLQLIAYLIDVAYGRRKPPQSPLDFAVFVSFFPQLLSGPIARGDLIDQLEKPRSPEASQFGRGSFEFLLGYVMKFLVAGTLGKYVDPVYANPASYDTASHWLTLYAYTCQIFCDFAGYSLMALGIGRLFGITLIENFRFPFLARNISDFWKRWHISLTNILFDYIYTPLVTGSGPMRGRLGLGLFLVLLVSGLWHGATWMFVLWGALHGLVLMTAHRWDDFYRGLCRKDRSWVQRRKSATYVWTAWALTQGWFMLSLIPFRSPDLATAATFASGLFGSEGTSTYLFGKLSNLLNVVVCLLLVPVYHWTATEQGKRVVNALFQLPAPVRGIGYGVTVVYLFLFQPLSEGVFVYANF